MMHARKTVAVIDDDGGVRASLRVLLAGLSYNVELFASAEAFLVAAPDSKANCLLVDVQLGDISGIELARQLAADGLTFPIIFMTGCDEEHIRSQAEAAGGVAFLKKPFPAKLLFDTLKKAMR